MIPALLLAIAIVTVGFLYAILPVAGFAYRRYKGRRTVACPESGRPAMIALDATRAALTATVGPPQLRIIDCSRWPERESCGRQCLRQVA